MPNSEHTSKQFEAELEAVRSRVLQMGGLVEEQIVRALEALSTGDMRLSAKVVEDDHRVNAMEVGIDEDCSTIIARRQPAAGDLRLVMMVVKTITDLERIGDEAAKIARMAKLINSVDRVQQPRYVEIRRMANMALEMLRKSLDCFARLDVSGSAKWCAPTSTWTTSSVPSFGS
jgi:phosphate transport system protein